jgi:hypothetical protein
MTERAAHVYLLLQRTGVRHDSLVTRFNDQMIGPLISKSNLPHQSSSSSSSLRYW